MDRFRQNGTGLDISKPLTFKFNGKAYQGYSGDTLASALLANGVRFIARSFKYHRPRGVYSDNSSEPNGLVTFLKDGHPEPNTRATQIEIVEGLEAFSQNAWPSLEFDLLSVNNIIAPLIPAGFYYKTFMWPKSFWESLYEPAIRRAAGLGALSPEADPSSYEKGYLHTDYLIVGAGLAGLLAASRLSRSGKEVILVDEGSTPGGRLLAEGEPDEIRWLSQIVSNLEAKKNVRLLIRTTIFGAYDHGVYGAISRNTEHLPGSTLGIPKQTYWRVTTEKTVIATGALDRPVIFSDNDKPGIMAAQAVESYAFRFASLYRYKIAIFTNNSDGVRLAKRLKKSGMQLVALIDARPNAKKEPGIAHFVGAVVESAYGTKGLSGLLIRLASGEKIRLDVQILGVSGGFNPLVQLTSHKGAKPVWDTKLSTFLASPSKPPDQIVVGAAAGLFCPRSILEQVITTIDGSVTEEAAESFPFPAREPLDLHWIISVSGRGRQFVDQQNDVTAKDIILSHREGMVSVEHLKRYTTLGMATDQGKYSNLIGLALMSELTAKSIEETGSTLSRPPYTPVSVGALAGRLRDQHFKPTRLTPSHLAAVELNASWGTVGNWLRARWYASNNVDSPRDIISREVSNVRSAVGVCDVTTLGKIDLQGTEALPFLNFLYANSMSSLKTGKCRYGIMLREDGVVMDDGTVARIGDNHFIVTTTTAKAASVFRHMEFVKQSFFSGKDIHLISITEAWAQFSVAGPNSRTLIQRIVDLDCSNLSFPFMACMVTTLKNGLPARLFRISFSGELAYEIAVPARFGNDFFKVLLEMGADLGISPYGTEALSVLRIEKGHPAGAELDGRTTVLNLGLDKMIRRDEDFIGRALSQRPELLLDTHRLVGFLPVSSKDNLVAGANLIDCGAEITAKNNLGRMTSVAYSPHRKSMIGLGFIVDGLTRIGDKVRLVSPLDDLDILVVIVDPKFIDPGGDRLRA